MAENQLTKKNSDYIFRLKKALSSDDSKFESEKIDEILNTTKERLLSGQKKGETATQIFGTINQHLLDIKDPKGAAARKKAIATNANGKPSDKKPAFDLMKEKNIFDYSFSTLALDTTMEMFILLFGMYGITGILSGSKASTNSMGIVTIAMLAIITGIFYTIATRIMTPNHKSTKPQRKMWQTILIVIAAILIWMGLFTAAAYLPRPINPIVPPIVLLVVALATFGFYWNWKKRMDMPRGFMPIGTLATNARLQYRQLHPKGAKK